jgi:hypothetical protein
MKKGITLNCSKMVVYHGVLKWYHGGLLYSYIITNYTGSLHIVQLLKIFHRLKHDMLKIMYQGNLVDLRPVPTS